MRTTYLLIALLFVHLAIANEVKSPRIKEGDATVSGYFDTSSVPFRIFVNHGLENEEVMFLRRVTPEDTVIYGGTYVTVKGHIGLYQNRQYMMNTEKIRLATEKELEQYE